LLFVFYYVAYITYLVLHATDHAAHTLFGSVMVLFVIPLTVLTLIVVTVRSMRAEASRG
jgi:cation:H+ antiporter